MHDFKAKDQSQTSDTQMVHHRVGITIRSGDINVLKLQEENVDRRSKIVCSVNILKVYV